MFVHTALSKNTYIFILDKISQCNQHAQSTKVYFSNNYVSKLYVIINLSLTMICKHTYTHTRTVSTHTHLHTLTHTYTHASESRDNASTVNGVRE